jgi:serine/threonine-protein kinase
MTAPWPVELQDALAGVLSIERELGRGGMGTVYLARDVALDRLCALKVLHPALAARPVERTRFLQEATTGARLSHPHIVPIFDVGEAAGYVWFVMGLVDGESLATRVARDGPLAPDLVERLLREVGWALANAHARGVLHRDVTLDNILLDRQTGRAMLADFGIAAPIDGTTSAELIGTAEYLAPELVHGEPATPAADLYALGIVAWSCLTGFLPFTDDDPGRVLLRQVRDPVPPLTRAAAGTPSRLRAAVEALLVKDPLGRPGSVETWLTMLDAAERDIQLAAPLRQWVDARTQVAPYHALALTLVAVASGFAVSFIGSNLAISLVLLSVLLTFGAMIIPLMARVGIALSSLRAVARAGFGVDDLRVALDRDIRTRARVGPVAPEAIGRLVRRLGLGAGAAAAVVIVATEWATALPWSVRFVLWDIGLPVLRWGLILFWLSRGIGYLLPGTETPALRWGDRLRQRFWRSPVADRLFALMRVGLRPTAPATTVHRPTELMLDLQIAARWNALPGPQRAGLDDLPRVARRLRERVQEMRDLLAVLARQPDTASGEVRALRERLNDRSAMALAALERLRLLVTRLEGAAAAPGDTTRALRDACAVDAELLIELGAHRDVGRILGRRTSVSLPSPTPA